MLACANSAGFAAVGATRPFSEVPAEAVVHNAGNPTGEGVVWYVHQGRTSDYFIRCFVPGDDA